MQLDMRMEARIYDFYKPGIPVRVTLISFRTDEIVELEFKHKTKAIRFLEMWGFKFRFADWVHDRWGGGAVLEGAE